MAVTAIDIQVEDVEASTQLLTAAYGWRVLTDDPNFGELDAGGVRIMLSREAMVPWGVPTESSLTTQSRMLRRQQTLQ